MTQKALGEGDPPTGACRRSPTVGPPRNKRIFFCPPWGCPVGSPRNSVQLRSFPQEHPQANSPDRPGLARTRNVRFVADEYRELDGERVLVLTHASGHGRTSGLDLGKLPTEGANLFHIHDGKVTRHVAYLQRDLALADLGLAEASRLGATSTDTTDEPIKTGVRGPVSARGSLAWAFVARRRTRIAPRDMGGAPLV